MTGRKSASPPAVPCAVEARILIVSPVRNEAAHIERVVRSVAAQELPPARWIVVDDRSDDGTLDILRRLEPELGFLTVMEAPAPPAGPVRDRLARAAAPRTFNVGLAAAGDLREYTHVMKLDGDIELQPDYFRELIARFDADPALGLAGGVLDEPTAGGGFRRIQIPRVHVHGALKLYSRACFEAIGGVQERLGWDTIDETYARMRGFTAWSFPDLVSIHHRPLGSADGTVRGHARHGECAYIAHFTVVLGRAARRQGRAPAPARAVGPRLLLRLRRGPRPAASSGSRTRSTAGSPTRSCAGGCSARSCLTTRERDERRNRRARLRRAATGDGVRRGRHRHRRRGCRHPEGGRAARRPLAHRGRAGRAARRASSDRCTLQHALRRPAGGRGRPDLRPDAADAEPRARAGPAAQRRARARRRRARRPDDRARVDDVPRHHARVPRAAAGGVRPARRRGLRARLLARARRSRAARTTRSARRRRSSAASPRRAPSARPRSTAASATASCPSARPRSAEMAKLLENIFRSVNIALVNELAMLADRMEIDIWEVVDAAVDQAVRLHALRAGAGHGRPLPAGRPVLPDLEGARVRPRDGVHRAGRQGQRADALLLHREDRAGAQRRPQARPRLPRARARRVLQAGRGGHPRVAGAEDPRAAAGARRRRRLPRPARARAARRSASPTTSSTTRWTAPTWP